MPYLRQILKLNNLKRLIHIFWVLIKYRVYLLLPPQKSKVIRFIKIVLPKNSGVKTRGESLRDALQTLGPVFIKFGQMISTRRDLVPEDIASYLETLQDRVTPFPAEEAREIIENNLASSIESTEAPPP